jgi:hypothetical protein
MFLVPNIDQMYKEIKKIVEVRNKHGNGDEFPDFADLFFFLAYIFLGSVGQLETIYFFLALILLQRSFFGTRYIDDDFF